jgi:peptidoglycan/xylan/chitin deacetylase (PgdA/CDA1 family)
VRLPVLLYHHIGPKKDGLFPSLTVEPAAFEKQVRWLAERGYAGIRPFDWLVWGRDTIALPKKPVLLTFDDGYADLADHAFPVLQRHGFGAGVFIVTRQIGGTNTWDDPQGAKPVQLLTSDQIRYWAARGIEFGSHGCTHADLTTLAPDRLLDEVAESKRELESILKMPVSSFAYPYGAHNNRVLECVRRNYELAFTVEEGLNDPRTDLFSLRRTMWWPAETTRDLGWKLRWGWNPLRRLRASPRLRSFALRTPRA